MRSIRHRPRMVMLRLATLALLLAGLARVAGVRAESIPERPADFSVGESPTPEPTKSAPVAPQTPSSQPAPAQSSGVGRLFRGFVDALFSKEQEVANPDAPAGPPDTLESTVDPPELEADFLLRVEDLTGSRPWQAPNYEGQVGALGWSESVFAVPVGLRERVTFWSDIYAKYTTWQGVIHDSVHVDIIYEMVDFSRINEDESLNSGQKHRAREKFVNDRRKEIEERLRSLHGRTSSEGLEAEDLRYWRLLENVSGPNKFVEAAKKGRVRFQLGQRDRFILGIFYSGRYLREMEKIFRDEGLPIELTRLPFVESSFNIHARSRVGASGVWQFMRRTARPIMMVNTVIDERNDPIKATWGSARVLRQNYAMLDSWPLAVTGYNHGPYGIRGITNRLGTRDLVEIINRYSSSTFGFASENFYACFLAALEVERNARKYFGDVKWSAEMEGREFKLERPLAFRDLLSWFDGDERRTLFYNPHLQPTVRKGRQAIPRRSFVRVPLDKENTAMAALKGTLKAPPVQGTTRVSAGKDGSGLGSGVAGAAESFSTRTYRVRRGDNLHGIARSYKVSIDDLIDANDLGPKGRIRAGQVLTIPGTGN